MEYRFSAAESGRLLAVPGEPAAFMTYARFNDAHDDGQLSAFRERLAAEVRAQTGREFVIFQDRADIAWGQNWRQRIGESLDVVTLLLVIVTPGLFGSTVCREEVARFREREQELGRSDLILPLYYISAREMDDPAMRESDGLAGLLASRQFADWRELRFEPFTSAVARRAVAVLASRMRDAFWRPRPVQAGPAAGNGRQAGTGAGPTGQAGVRRRATARRARTTHVVDAWQRGDFRTVSAAIEAARPGDLIMVRPGLYEEHLVVDKPLEIVGDGPVADIVVRARSADALAFRTSTGRVANLTLRQAGGEGGGGENWSGVDIAQGRLDLEGCDISSQSLACVAVHGGADPRLRRNHVHVGKDCGVLVRDGGLGTLEDNDITASAGPGVQITSGGNPTLLRNRIHAGRNCGVCVSNRGLGMLAGNDITADDLPGVAIETGGNPTLRRNRVNRNGCEAVRISDGGRGVLEDNDLTGNTNGAWGIADDCKANVTHAGNKE